MKNFFGKKIENNNEEDQIKLFQQEIKDLKIELEMEREKNSLLQENEKLNQKENKKIEEERLKYEKEKEELLNEINVWKENAFTNSIGKFKIKKQNKKQINRMNHKIFFINL